MFTKKVWYTMAFFIPVWKPMMMDWEIKCRCRELGQLSLTYGIYVFPRAGSIHVCCTVRHPSGSAPVKINRSTTEHDGQCLHQIQTRWSTLASNTDNKMVSACIKFRQQDGQSLHQIPTTQKLYFGVSGFLLLVKICILISYLVTQE